MLRVFQRQGSIAARNPRIACPSLFVRTLAVAMSLPVDVRDFLEGYPRVPDEPSLKANLEFYSNTRRCKPDNLLIDQLHEQ